MQVATASCVECLRIYLLGAQQLPEISSYVILGLLPRGGVRGVAGEACASVRVAANALEPVCVELDGEHYVNCEDDDDSEYVKGVHGEAACPEGLLEGLFEVCLHRDAGAAQPQHGYVITVDCWGSRHLAHLSNSMDVVALFFSAGKVQEGPKPSTLE